MRSPHVILALFVLVAVAAPAFAQDAAPTQDKPLWVEDYDAAVAIAKKEGKDLLIDFTGSDWCGWCKRLDAEVFSTDLFVEKAPATFVLTKLDFPRSEEVKAKVPNPARNEELSKKWSIRGFPTILLVTPEGAAYASTGYREGGPEPYLEHLAELREDGRAALAKVEKLAAAVGKAEGDEKVALVEEAIGQLASLEEGSPLAATLADTVKLAMTLDPKNEKGLKLKAVNALMDAGRLDDEIVGAAKELDPKNEKGLMEKVVFAQLQAINSEEGVKAFCKTMDELDAMGPIHDDEIAKMLYANAAIFNQRFTQDMEAAKKYAKKAMPYAEDEDRLKQMLEQILNG